MRLALVLSLRAAVRMKRVLHRKRARVWAQLDMEPEPEPEPEPGSESETVPETVPDLADSTPEPEPEPDPVPNPLLQYTSSAFDSSSLSTKPEVDEKALAKLRKCSRFRDVLDRYWCDTAVQTLSDTSCSVHLTESILLLNAAGWP
eukprot:COSAG02_NODE_13963_length_1326_cov_1.387938_2_plen_146_part_00